MNNKNHIQNWIYPIVISTLVIFLVNLPLIYFYLFPKEGLYFLGRRVINSQDMYTYLSFIEQSRQGKWLFSNLYTSEIQTPTLVRPLYLLIGKIAGFVGISSLIVYHAGRIIFSVLFCGVLYFFLGKLFVKKWEHIFAYILILTSSGLGFILGFFFPESLDLWVPEANTFLSLAKANQFLFYQH